MLPHILLERLQEAVRAVRPDADPAALQVRPAADPRFGDYQTSSLIALAKAEGQNPRQLADAVRAHLQVSDLCAEVQVAGAGFLNFFLSPAAVSNLLAGALRGDHLFFRPANPARTFVIDFSSPNVAKPMHVGHIRSTILGDCLARNLRLLGHRVITDNHIGDWGTQFGMLLAYLRAARPEVMRAPDTLRIEDLETFYRAAKERFDQDPDFRELARRTVVELQSGDPPALELWRAFCRESLRHCQEIYAALEVRFDYALGESFFNSRLPSLVRELQATGLARESEGAIVVFFDDQPDLKSEGPAIIQKRDGGFNYTTTDLATLEYRVAQWAPDEIVYVTDGRQQLHFKQLFNVYRRWQPAAKVNLVHVWFGSILGEDGKPFKTRSGENVKLQDLLAEAIERAFAVVSEKNPDLPADVRREIARVVGIGAVKYADLLPNRQSDYVFSWDKILALQGNVAPYLQYSYSRIQSIYRKAEEPLPLSWDDLALEHPDERALAAHLLNFGFTLEAVAEEYRPNYLCNYLYELSSRFARFFENCPVLRAAPPARTTRLGLCRLTGQVLAQGLNVLGIQTVDRM